MLFSGAEALLKEKVPFLRRYSCFVLLAYASLNYKKSGIEKRLPNPDSCLSKCDPTTNATEIVSTLYMHALKLNHISFQWCPSNEITVLIQRPQGISLSLPSQAAKKTPRLLPIPALTSAWW